MKILSLPCRLLRKNCFEAGKRGGSEARRNIQFLLMIIKIAIDNNAKLWRDKKGAGKSQSFADGTVLRIWRFTKYDYLH